MAWTDFLKGTGENEGILVCVFATQAGSFNHQGGSLVCFANQESTLAHVFQLLGHSPNYLGESTKTQKSIVDTLINVIIVVILCDL